LIGVVEKEMLEGKTKQAELTRLRINEGLNGGPKTTSTL